MTTFILITYHWKRQETVYIFLIIIDYISIVSILPLLCFSFQPTLHSHSQSLHCCPCPRVIHTCSLTSPFPFFPPFNPRLPSGSCQSVPCFHASGSVLLIGLFCSLDSSYKWDHMVFVLQQLTSFTQHNTLQFQPCCHKRYGFFHSFCCIVFYCVNVPQFVDPLIYKWALRLFPALGYCK